MGSQNGATMVCFCRSSERAFGAWWIQMKPGGCGRKLPSARDAGCSRAVRARWHHRGFV